MGLCNFFSFICCPKRFHRNNVLNIDESEEVILDVDEFEQIYRESSRLVDVYLES